MPEDKKYEKITVKPSIELIPDEYELPEKIVVHTFTSNTVDEQENARLFIESLNENHFKMEENRHCLDTENFDKVLDNIKNDVTNSSGLILFFSCCCDDYGMINTFDGERSKSIPIQDVVKKFTAYTCLELKNKPKIFVFYIKSPSLMIQTDGSMYGSTYDVTYDTPGEADMLIVYKKNEKGDSLDFVEKLCQNIKEFGNIEDVVSLVTCLKSDPSDSRPLVVSTLTRKLYLTPSEHRGHHFHINRHHEEIRKHLDDINTKLSKASTSDKAKRSAASAAKTSKETPTKESTRKFSSRPLWTTGSDATSSSGNATRRVKKTDMSGSRGRLTSSTTATSADTRNSRSRLSSTKSDGNLADKNKNVSDSNDKPRWRY